MIQKLFTFFLALVAGMGSICASDTRVNGIWYDFDDSNKTASVTYRGSSHDRYKGEYSGSVTIPKTVTYNGTTYSVTSIGTSAFYECEDLTFITIPNSVTTIGNYAFYDCDALGSVTIPNSVTSIGKGAFYYCDALTSVTIPNSVTSIGDDAFYECKALTSITIGNSVTSIGDQAFSNCSSLTTVHITDISAWCGIEFFDYTANPLYYAKNLYLNGELITDLVIPESATSIGNYAFFNCDALTSVTIPNSVTSIGYYAFYYCTSFNEVTLPASITFIGENAFAGCTKLYDIYSYAMEPPTAYESSFANYNAFLHVPCDNQRVYLLDIIFGNFKYIECVESEEATTDGNVTVIPGYNDVTITWPTDENADTYSLVINKSGEPFCTLTFNADGQLLNIAFAPARNGNNRSAQYAAQTTTGYRFTVTGLTEDTQYAYDITTKDASNKTIATYSGEFKTMGDNTTAVEEVLYNTTNCKKIIRNGQLLIICDDKTYNLMGQEM